jgi:hypothetical protein
MKMDLLTNATVVDDAIRFVSQKSKEWPISDSNNKDNNESNEPHYNEAENQAEEGQEVESREFTVTTNQVF